MRNGYSKSGQIVGWDPKRGLNQYGCYYSTTAATSGGNYLDATTVPYVVAPGSGGICLGDRAKVTCNGRSFYAVVGDTGNPSNVEVSGAVITQCGWTWGYQGTITSGGSHQMTVEYYPHSGNACTGVNDRCGNSP